MGKRGQAIRMALAGIVALGLAACQTQSSPPPAPMPMSGTVLDDQLVAKLKEAKGMDQVRALIDAKPTVNYQAGREIWIYQGIAKAGSTQGRTVTVQYDGRGGITNVGVADLN